MIPVRAVRVKSTRNAVVPKDLPGLADISSMPRNIPGNIFTAVLLLTAFVTPASADIYKYTDAEGRITFSDEPPAGHTGQRLLQRFSFGHSGLENRPASQVNYAALEKNRERFTSLIEEVARQTLLRPELLHAVIRAESAYDPDAVSRKGAVGLMQLMPATAKRYGVSDRRNPRQNLLGGATYLRDLLIQFNFDLKLAVAAYNAGENAVIRSGHQIPNYSETRNYVAKVLRFYRENRLDNS